MTEARVSEMAHSRAILPTRELVEIAANFVELLAKTTGIVADMAQTREMHDARFPVGKNLLKD